MREKQIEDLMQEELDEGETTVILDRQKDKEEKGKRREQAEQIQNQRDEDKELKKKYKTLVIMEGEGGRAIEGR